MIFYRTLMFLSIEFINMSKLNQDWSEDHQY